MEVPYACGPGYTSIMKAALVPFAFILFCVQSIVVFVLFNHILIPNDNYNNNLTIWFEFPYLIF